tara:strand:+ start:14 stop:283 length:270 start_codon:yes stop_codon:yes gene_type:complete
VFLNQYVVEPETDVANMLFASFATAYVGGIPKKIKKGVIRKPPPTPNKPERIPTMVLREKIVITFTDTSAMGKKTSIYYFNLALKKFPR